MFSAGRPSRLPDWGGREAELPLLISFSHGDLDTIKTGHTARTDYWESSLEKCQVEGSGEVRSLQATGQPRWSW